MSFSFIARDFLGAARLQRRLTRSAPQTSSTRKKEVTIMKTRSLLRRQHCRSTVTPRSSRTRPWWLPERRELWSGLRCRTRAKQHLLVRGVSSCVGPAVRFRLHPVHAGIWRRGVALCEWHRVVIASGPAERQHRRRARARQLGADACGGPVLACHQTPPRQLRIL